MPETPEFHSIVGSFPCQVQWGDCDPAGIIFYPTYFRWMDAATWAFMEAVGFGPQRMRTEERTLAVVSAECQFPFPAEQSDLCEVRTPIARFGGKTLVV